MDLDFSPDQRLVKDSAREFLAKQFPTSLTREVEDSVQGNLPDIWTRIAELGWLGLIIPEEYGGSAALEGSFMELCIVLEEMGRACFASPFFSTAMCSLALAEAGNAAQKETFLPRIAEGKLIMALALTEPSARYDAGGISVRAVPGNDEYVITGNKLFIHDAQVADYLLCVVRTEDTSNPEEGISLLLVDSATPGITVNQLFSIAKDHQNEVIFDNVRVPKNNLLGKGSKSWPLVKRLLEQATIAKCAETIGSAFWVLDASVSYSKERVQYDRPIGSFGIIQHYLADMWTEINMAKRFVYYVMWLVDRHRACAKEVSMAKAWVNEVYKRWTRMGVQIHGAIGTTQEHDMTLHYRRSRQMPSLFGDTDFHLERVADAMDF